MKNIQIIDDADNAVFDIFSATEKKFSLIFANGHDVAFIDEVMALRQESELNDAFNRLWTWRIPQRDAMGINGILFYESDHKKQYQPTWKDEEACNPEESQLL